MFAAAAGSRSLFCFHGMKRSRRFPPKRRLGSKLPSLPLRFLHRRLALHPSVQYTFLELPPIPQFECRDASLGNILIKRVRTHPQVT